MNDDHAPTERVSGHIGSGLTFLKCLWTLVFVLLVLALPAFGQSMTPAAWVADFTQLKQEMSTHYANLEWAISERGLDLKQMSADTEERLLRSASDIESRVIIGNFLREFGDAHLAIDWKVPKTESGLSNATKGTATLCSELGYRANPNMKTGVPFFALKNFVSSAGAESKYFPAGILNLAGGKKIGVIRIGLFMENIFPDLCESVTREMNVKSDAECGEDCRNQIGRRVSALVTGIFAKQITNLKKERINALVVDITGNGGGSNWYEAAAKTLTPKAFVPTDTGFIRHEHWVRQLKQQLETVRADLALTREPSQRKILSRAMDELNRRIAEAEKVCDRSGVWSGNSLNCSLVVRAPSALVPMQDALRLTDNQTRRMLIGDDSYKVDAGVYSGKLFILIDQRTASSSEGFASLLKDNGSAVIIGQPSMGAGCGWTNGGIATILANSGAYVKMPDCVRFRPDGSNEVGGITPDVLIGWRQNDTPFQKARRVADALERL